MAEPDVSVSYTVKEMLALMDQRAELREQSAAARHEQTMAKIDQLSVRVASVETRQATHEGEAKGAVDSRARLLAAATLVLMTLAYLPNIVAAWVGKGA